MKTVEEVLDFLSDMKAPLSIRDGATIGNNLIYLCGLSEALTTFRPIFSDSEKTFRGTGRGHKAAVINLGQDIQNYYGRIEEEFKRVRGK